MQRLEQAELATQESLEVGVWRNLQPVKGRRVSLSLFTFLTPTFLLLGYLIRPLWWLNVIAFVMGIYEYARLAPYRVKPNTITDPMLDLPPQENQFPVRIALLHKYDPYGRDLGVLTVMDGGLHFSGQHSDFSLTHHNARLKSKDPYLINASKPPPQYLVDFQVGDFRGQMEVAAVGAVNAQLCKALLAWEQASPDLAWANTLNPPVTRKPRTRPPEDWNLGLQLCSYIEAMIAMSLAVSPSWTHDSLGIVLARFMSLGAILVAAFWFGLAMSKKRQT